MQQNSLLLEDRLFKRGMRLMGNHFEITVVATDEKKGNQFIDAAVKEIQRIEELLSTYKPNSQTNLINDNAGIKPVSVELEFIDLIDRSLKISRLTQGAFDITYGSIDKSLWNFDVKMTALPSEDIAKASVELIDYKNVEIDYGLQTVYLKRMGMRIGFGGIGKGYAADKAKSLLQKLGVKSGVVNAAGDLVTWGTQPNGQPWTVGIADPNRKNPYFSKLNISNMAIATSGNYEKFAMIDGKRYSHTIDPHTGMPASGIKSVSVLCPSAELADALATPIIVMGTKVGLDLINQLKNIACVIIDDHDRLFTSDNIKNN